MYKVLIRPLLFLFDPERAHHLVVLVIKTLCGIPGMYQFIRRMTKGSGTIEPIDFAGIKFDGRVGMAAGFDKNADFYKEISVLGFSFVEIGTVTPLPQPGNPKPRLFRLVKDGALVNRMGFNNKGVEYAVTRLKRRNNTIVVGGNIGKNTVTPNEKAVDDYAVCFAKLYDVVDYFTVNVSCPNIAGMDKLQDIGSLREILTRIVQIRIRMKPYKPVFLKIAPDLSFRQIDDILALVGETGLDGVIATNTTTSRECLATDAERITTVGQGGLSGKPLTNRVLEMVRYICKQSGGKLPVIAVGGIMSREDALNLIKAGAGLIQLYTGLIYEGPLLVRKINLALQEYSHEIMVGKPMEPMNENVPGRI